MKTNNFPWQMFGLLAVIISSIALTLFVGWLALKAYRRYRPLDTNVGDNPDLVGIEQGDGFFKVLFIGAVLCAPFFYLLYDYIFLKAYLQ